MFLLSKINVEVNLFFVLAVILPLIIGALGTKVFPVAEKHPFCLNSRLTFSERSRCLQAKTQRKRKEFPGRLCAGRKVLTSGALSVLHVSPYPLALYQTGHIAAADTHRDGLLKFFDILKFSHFLGKEVQRGSSRWHTSCVEYSPLLSGNSACNQPAAGRQVTWVPLPRHPVTPILFYMIITRCPQFPRLQIHLTFLP